jgi:hypothetical protein
MARRRRKVKKRVCAIPRAPDGSAFFNWYVCIYLFIHQNQNFMLRDFSIFMVMIECVHIYM